MTGSLHGRLIILVGACSAVGLAVFGLLVSFLVESQLWSQFDTGLRDRILQLTQLVEQGEGEIEFEWNESAVTPIHADGERLTCWEGGRVIAVVPKNSAPLPVPNATETPRVYDVSLEDRPGSSREQPGRAIAMEFVPRMSGAKPAERAKTVVLAVARPTSEVQSTIEIIRWSLAAAAVLALLLSSAGTWIAVRRGLAPIDGATRRIAEISPQRLDQQISDVEHHPTELQPLLTTINELLSRLRIAMERERTLSGEIAHEMRTPLAGLRAKFDVALSRSRSVAELQSMIKECSHINDSATSMIESLMATVAPVTNEGQPTDRVSLSQVVEECLLQYDDWLTQRGLFLHHRIQDGVYALGSEHSIRIVVRNLMDNAVSYADAGTTIKILCCQVENIARLTIQNQASEFPADKIDQVFERFWRADVSRTKSEVHSGLGLALTKRVIEAYGGAIGANYRAPVFEIVAEWNAVT